MTNIKNFKEFNESFHHHKDFIHLVGVLRSECAHENIELVKELGGEVKFKNPINLSFYTDESCDATILKEITSITLAVDENNELEEKYGAMLDSNAQDEYLYATTTDGESIVINATITTPPYTTFDLWDILADVYDHKRYI